MNVSQKDNSKILISTIKEFLGDIDYSQDMSTYIYRVDEKIRELIQGSGLQETEQLEQDYRKFRRQLLIGIREGNITSFGDVSSFLVQFGLSPIPESIQKQEVLKGGIDNDFWERSGEKKPAEGVIYRGGTARKILREYLDISENPADIKTDIDIFVGPEQNIDDIRDQLGCDAEGITQLNDISEASLENKCRLVDIGMNQVLVSGDTIYYTEKSQQALKTGISELLEEPEDLFGKKCYDIGLGRIIFSNQKIYRMMSMLVRGKLESVSIRRDNISAENSESIGGMEKYIIIVLKKIISQAGDDLEVLSKMIYRYADILNQMGYISQHQDVFGFLQTTHQNGPVKVHDSYLDESFDDGGKRDMLWRLDKVTRLLVRKIIPDELKEFKTDSRNTIVKLGVDYSDFETFGGIFSSQWKDFYAKIREQDEEKG